jgi:predicted ABC-type ATPase
VPRSDVLRRCERSLANLIKAAKIVDKLSLYDNSTSLGHQLVAIRDRDRTVIYMPELPKWIDRVNLNL